MTILQWLCIVVGTIGAIMIIVLVYACLVVSGRRSEMERREHGE